MAWIARKKQKIQRGQKIVWVNPGDPLPEANSWRYPQIWRRRGFIDLVEGEEDLKPTTKKKSLKPCPFCGREFERLGKHKCEFAKVEIIPEEKIDANDRPEKQGAA